MRWVRPAFTTSAKAAACSAQRGGEVREGRQRGGRRSARRRRGGWPPGTGRSTTAARSRRRSGGPWPSEALARQRRQHLVDVHVRRRAASRSGTTSIGNWSSWAPASDLGGGGARWRRRRRRRGRPRAAVLGGHRPLDAGQGVDDRRSAPARPRSGSSRRPAGSGPATWPSPAPGPRPWCRARCGSPLGAMPRTVPGAFGTVARRGRDGTSLAGRRRRARPRRARRRLPSDDDEPDAGHRRRTTTRRPPRLCDRSTATIIAERAVR